MKNKIQTQIGIGIDCGTSGVRVCALTSHGKQLAQAQTELDAQTPNAWWEAICSVMDKLAIDLAHRCQLHNITINRCAISFDATSSTVFLTDTLGNPISDVSMYYHSHPEWASILKNLLSNDSGAHGANSSLAKVLALSHYLSNKQTWRACHQADWIGQQLTGTLGISDENNALKLGYDVQSRSWPDSILKLIPNCTLPHVLPPATPFSSLLPVLAKRWKLPESTQVTTGTTDSIAAFLATNANLLGDAVISLGSTLAFKLLCEKPYFDANSGIYSHRLWEQWLVGGASNAGGAVLLEYFSLDQLKKLSPLIDTQSLLNIGYYPLPKQVRGERFPHANPNLKAQLTPRLYSDTHFLQAMLEGLVNIEKDGWSKLESQSEQSIQRLFSCGGGTKNPAWTRLRKQQLSYKTATPFSQDAAVGSAMLALKGLGVKLT